MEEEIQERLEKVYNFPIDVKFIDFRKYEICCKIDKNLICIPILYDGSVTLENNITNCIYKIDKEILKIYKRSEEKCLKKEKEKMN